MISKSDHHVNTLVGLIPRVPVLNQLEGELSLPLGARSKAVVKRKKSTECEGHTFLFSGLHKYLIAPLRNMALTL